MAVTVSSSPLMKTISTDQSTAKLYELLKAMKSTPSSSSSSSSSQNQLNFNETNDKGLTPLMVATQLKKYQHVQLLLSFTSTHDDNDNQDNNSDNNNSLNVNHRDSSGRTALYIACLNNDYQTARLLIQDDRTDVNIPTYASFTPFYMACLTHNLDLIKCFLRCDRFNTLNTPDRNGCSPLLVACKRGYYNVVQLLLMENSLNVNQIDNEGVSAISFSFEMCDWELVSLFVLDKRSDLLYPCPAVKELKVDKKVDCATPLKVSVAYSSNKIVKLLLSSGRRVFNTIQEVEDCLLIARNDGNYVLEGVLSSYLASPQKTQVSLTNHFNVSSLSSSHSTSSRSNSFAIACADGDLTTVRALLKLKRRRY